MGQIKALLVGINDYRDNPPCNDLPWCYNDVQAISKALAYGLRAQNNDIIICGNGGYVTNKDVFDGLIKLLTIIQPDDTFIFYFSGHGSTGGNLSLSNININRQDIINLIEKTKAKNKLVILDSCFSGDNFISDTPNADFTQSIDDFVGKGCAVLASCWASQTSGFDENRQLSIFTSFLVDAFTCKGLIRQGKISLNDIHNYTLLRAKNWNAKRPDKIQDPVFRSNIPGTIFFDVEDYQPYNVREFYEETDEYIIYKVDPVHTNAAKRFSVDIILRSDSTAEEVSVIFAEIKDKLMYCEIASNEQMELQLKGKPTNILFGYLGYDEKDIVNRNFAYRTIWVDSNQDKKEWYKPNGNSQVLNDIFVIQLNSYMAMRKLYDNPVDKDALIKETRQITEEMVNAAGEIISSFNEYRNNVLTEEQLIEKVEPLNKEIRKLFLKQSNLDIPPKEIKEWSDIYATLCGTISDFSLYYDKRNFDKWDKDARIALMNITIKNYTKDLEKLKVAEAKLPKS